MKNVKKWETQTWKKKNQQQTNSSVDILVSEGKLVVKPKPLMVEQLIPRTHSILFLFPIHLNT